MVLTILRPRRMSMGMGRWGMAFRAFRMMSCWLRMGLELVLSIRKKTRLQKRVPMRRTMRMEGKALDQRPTTNRSRHLLHIQTISLTPTTTRTPHWKTQKKCPNVWPSLPLNLRAALPQNLLSTQTVWRPPSNPFRSPVRSSKACQPSHSQSQLLSNKRPSPSRF